MEGEHDTARETTREPICGSADPTSPGQEGQDVALVVGPRVFHPGGHVCLELAALPGSVVGGDGVARALAAHHRDITEDRREATIVQGR